MFQWGGLVPLEEPGRVEEEDVLRVLYERGGGSAIEDVVEELGGDREAVERAVRSLSARGLVAIRDGEAVLTEEGRREAEELARIHREIEEEAERLLGGRLDAHLLAHVLEHARPRREFVERLLEEARRGLRRLAELSPGRGGRVVAVLEEKPRLISRLYGVGVAPGRRVRVVARGKGFVVVETGGAGRVAVLDEDVASKVLVAPEDTGAGR